MLTTRMAVSVVLFLSLSGPSLAQPASSRPAGLPPAVVRPPEYARSAAVPEELLGPPRREVIILPSQPGEVGEAPELRSQGTQKKLAAAVPLLPEGYVVASREARLTRRDRWYEMELAKAHGLPEAPPLRVLPNQRLAMLEAILSGAQEAPTFVVTGRVTEFLGANYLLIENLEEVSRRAGRSAASGEPGRAVSATRPGASVEPTAEEVMERLLRHRAVRPVVLPDRVAKVAPDSRPAAESSSGVTSASHQTTWPEEALLVDRVGRVAPGEQWWTLVFEDQGQQPRQKPIALLPNQLLETAIALSGGGSRGAVFVVSGEVTLYGGANYLLLRKVIVRRDLGNLR